MRPGRERSRNQMTKRKKHRAIMKCFLFLRVRFISSFLTFLFLFLFLCLTGLAVVCPFLQYGTISMSRRSGPPVVRDTNGDESVTDTAADFFAWFALIRSLRYAARRERKERSARRERRRKFFHSHLCNCGYVCGRGRGREREFSQWKSCKPVMRSMCARISAGTAGRSKVR